LCIEPDPYGIDTGNPTGDESGIWAPGVSISGTQELTIGGWIWTGSNPGHNGGAYLGVDFRSSPGTIIGDGSIDSYTGASSGGVNEVGAPYIILSWGSGGWVHVEMTCHCTSSSASIATVWMLVQPNYQGGSTVQTFFDDMYVTYGTPTYSTS
jgi:hypothetical protein